MMMCRGRLGPRAARVLFTAAIALLLSTPLAGQAAIDWDPRTAEMTRDELLEIVQRLEDAADSPGYSARIREQARGEAAFIRNRLETGDFQVGDRVVLRVQGNARLTDTLVVQPGRVVTLPDIGEIPLEGVLRSELQAHLEQELGRYVQDPVVRAQSLIRIAVLGQVGIQGFYAIPAESLVEEALMVAGAPSPEADLERMEIRRGDRVLWSGQALQDAIIEGRTLDQLNLRAGDRIIVPQRQRGIFADGIVRGVLVVLPSLLLIAGRIWR